MVRLDVGAPAVPAEPRRLRIEVIFSSTSRFICSYPMSAAWSNDASILAGGPFLAAKCRLLLIALVGTLYRSSYRRAKTSWVDSTKDGYTHSPVLALVNAEQCAAPRAGAAQVAAV